MGDMMFIKERAAKIKAELQNGLLFGDPINWEDPDVVLVAAYYLGRQHVAQVHGLVSYGDAITRVRRSVPCT